MNSRIVNDAATTRLILFESLFISSDGLGENHDRGARSNGATMASSGAQRLYFLLRN